MSERVIEVDDEKVEAVRALLGTETLMDTVDVAFDEVLALDRRRRGLLASPRGEDVDVGDLADPAARGAAWG